MSHADRNVLSEMIVLSMMNGDTPADVLRHNGDSEMDTFSDYLIDDDYSIEETDYPEGELDLDSIPFVTYGQVHATALVSKLLLSGTKPGSLDSREAFLKDIVACQGVISSIHAKEAIDSINVPGSTCIDPSTFVYHESMALISFKEEFANGDFDLPF